MLSLDVPSMAMLLPIYAVDDVDMSVDNVESFALTQHLAM